MFLSFFAFRSELRISEASGGAGPSSNKARCFTPGCAGYDITVTNVNPLIIVLLLFIVIILLMGISGIIILKPVSYYVIFTAILTNKSRLTSQYRSSSCFSQCSVGQLHRFKSQVLL